MQYLLELNNQKYKNLENIHPVYSYLSFNDNLSTLDLYEKFEEQVNNAINTYVHNQINEFINRWLHTINLITVSNNPSIVNTYRKSLQSVMDDLDINYDTQEKFQNALIKTINKFCNINFKNPACENITNSVLQDNAQKLDNLITHLSDPIFIKEQFRLDFDSFELDKDDSIAILNKYLEEFTEFKPEPIMQIVPYPYKEC